MDDWMKLEHAIRGMDEYIKWELDSLKLVDCELWLSQKMTKNHTVKWYMYVIKEALV